MDPKQIVLVLFLQLDNLGVLLLNELLIVLDFSLEHQNGVCVTCFIFRGLVLLGEETRSGLLGQCFVQVTVPHSSVARSEAIQLSLGFDELFSYPFACVFFKLEVSIVPLQT
jgi:hypothetical protein